MGATARADRGYMARALELARRGLYTASPNPRVGCVIVREGIVLGEGWHERPGLAHAEVAALADARARGHDVAGATAYVTLEPCNHTGRTGPCVDALIAARVARVAVATQDAYRPAAGGAARLRAAGIDVDIGLMENEARALNRGFFARLERGRPWVRAKVAMSLDGRTALSGGESQWITGPEARADGHAWRARACAILTGVGTVLQDDPQLTVRAVDTPRQPLRIVVDRHADTPANARVLQGGGTLVVTAGPGNPQWPAGTEALALPDANGRVDLAALLAALAARAINEVHVEAGARLNGALLEAGLLDEVLVYVAPAIIGDPARGGFERAAPLMALAQRANLAIDDVERVGTDLRILARVMGTQAA